MSVLDDRRLSAPMGRTQVRRQLRSGYRRSMRLVALGTTLPGAGLLRTSARKTGSVLLIAFLRASQPSPTSWWTGVPRVWACTC